MRIDTVRNRIDATIALLLKVADEVEDLHVLAYDRPAAKDRVGVSGGAVDYALDTHGDPRARELLQRLASQAISAIEELAVTSHEVTQFMEPGRASTRRTKTGDCTVTEVASALAARERRIVAGEYRPHVVHSQPRVPTEAHRESLEESLASTLAGFKPLGHHGWTCTPPKTEGDDKPQPAEHMKSLARRVVATVEREGWHPKATK